MGDFVQVYEMSPRDGLQNEARVIAFSDKIKLVNLLSDCGFQKIEVASFVSPKWVPQMADSDRVLAGIKRRVGGVYAALTPNMRGYDAALAARADEVSVFLSASEGFSQANINCSIAQSIERFRPILAAAEADRMPVRGYISCVSDCPFDGATPPKKVAELAEVLMGMGCYGVSLGDTIGAATPDNIARMLDAVVKGVGAECLAGHFHDTQGRALANIAVALNYGLRVFDGAVGGLGGCPYAPGAAGNVDSVAMVEMLHGDGFETGLDIERMKKAALFARGLTG